MAKPSLSSIYNRLNNVDPYHPYETQTFSDWSVEAGDVVSVSRDGKKYNSPLSSTTLEWNGAPKVTMVSSGQQKRDSVTRAAEKKYSRGGGGYRNSKDVNTSITQTQTMIELEAHDRSKKDAELSASIKVSAGQIESLVQKTGVNKLGKTETLYSRIQQNANSIKLTVKKGDVISSINQTAEKIKIKASKIELDGVVTMNDQKVLNTSIAYGEIDTLNTGHISSASDLFIDVVSVTCGCECWLGNLNCGDLQCLDISSGGTIKCDGYKIDGNSNTAKWQSKTVVTEVKRSASRQFVYAVNGSTSNLSTITGNIVTGVTTETIYYLGHT